MRKIKDIRPTIYDITMYMGGTFVFFEDGGVELRPCPFYPELPIKVLKEPNQ